MSEPLKPPRPSIIDAHLVDGIILRPNPGGHLVNGDKAFGTKLRACRAGLAVELKSEKYLVPWGSVAFVRLSGPWED